jgi:hypothetical protein
MMSGRSAFLAILGGEHLDVAEQLEPHLQHVDAVVDVFDVEQFDHDSGPPPYRV